MGIDMKRLKSALPAAAIGFLIPVSAAVLGMMAAWFISWDFSIIPASDFWEVVRVSICLGAIIGFMAGKSEYNRPKE